MKIVFCLPHLKLSGGVRVILTHARELSSLGHEVTVLANESSRRNLWLKKIFGAPLTWFNLPAQVRVAYVNAATVHKVITKISPDVVVADSAGIARWFINSPFKVVHTIQHDERLYHGIKEQVSQVYGQPFKKVVVSTWLQEMLKTDFNQDSDLILNSFDRNLFYPVSGAKVNDDKVRVLVLDHPYEWKGTSEAVKMVRELQIKYPHVVLMGFGAKAGEASKDFDEFYFEPKQEELSQIYSRADIFLCPSWDEGFGLPSLEAMACSTALVTYDNGGSRDFARGGETALVSPRRDEQSLKHNLERLIVDQKLRQKIAAGGLKLAQSWPTWPEQARKLEKVLKSVITD